MILRSVITACVALCLTPGVAAAPRETAPDEWVGVGRIVAVGDVHGTYDKLVAILMQSDLVDADLNWIGGEDHLVLTGDFLDRGKREREVADLLIRLQSASAAAGGRAHVLMGNHELMNLIRDLRYVQPEGFAEFAGDESARKRKKLRKRWVKAQVEAGKNADIARANFDKNFPPGFLARSRAFERGYYGSWLIRQPATLKINGIVFVHGGISAEIAALGVQEINRVAREGVREYLLNRAVLEDRGLITGASKYRDHQAVAHAIVESDPEAVGPELEEAAKGMRAYKESPIHGSQGPMWHRAYAKQNERFERDNLTQALDSLGARTMVVGHTITRDKDITSRFSGRLLRADVGMAYGGGAQALIFESDSVRVLDAEKGTIREPEVEPPPGIEIADEGVDADSLGEWLVSAPVIGDLRSGGIETRDSRRVHLRQDGVSAYGAFWGTGTVATHRRAAQELAVSALDRMLGWNLVPLTVTREIDGVAGALQQIDERAVDGQSVDEHDLPLWDADELALQRARAAMLDALIGNCRRPSSEMLYLPEEQRLLLVNHSRSLSISLLAGCDEEAPAPEFEVDPESLRALESLDLASLTAELGDWLNAQQIDAILARRDRLVATSYPVSTP